MPFTPTMLIVNAVISEQQKNQENRDLDSGDKQNIFADIGKLKVADLDKYYESDG